jgi:hypothetical protein
MSQPSQDLAHFENSVLCTCKQKFTCLNFFNMYLFNWPTHYTGRQDCQPNTNY